MSNLDVLKDPIFYYDAIFGEILSYLKLYDIYQTDLICLSKFHYNFLFNKQNTGIIKQLIINDWGKYVFIIHGNNIGRALHIAQKSQSVHLFCKYLYTNFLSVINMIPTHHPISHHDNIALSIKEITKCGNITQITRYISNCYFQDEQIDCKILKDYAIRCLLRLIRWKHNMYDQQLINLYKKCIVHLYTPNIRLLDKIFDCELYINHDNESINFALFQHVLSITISSCNVSKQCLDHTHHRSICEKVLEQCIMKTIVKLDDPQLIIRLDRYLTCSESKLLQSLKHFAKHWSKCVPYGIVLGVNGNSEYKNQIIDVVKKLCDILTKYREVTHSLKVPYTIKWDDDSITWSRIL